MSDNGNGNDNGQTRLQRIRQGASRVRDRTQTGLREGVERTHNFARTTGSAVVERANAVDFADHIRAQARDRSPAERASATAQMAPPVDATFEPTAPPSQAADVASAGIESFGIVGGDFSAPREPEATGTPFGFDDGPMAHADDLVGFAAPPADSEQQQQDGMQSFGLVFDASEDDDRDETGFGLTFDDGDQDIGLDFGDADGSSGFAFFEGEGGDRR